MEQDASERIEQIPYKDQKGDAIGLSAFQGVATTPAKDRDKAGYSGMYKQCTYGDHE
jgi:hypothetical protein